MLGNHRRLAVSPVNSHLITIVAAPVSGVIIILARRIIAEVDIGDSIVGATVTITVRAIPMGIISAYIFVKYAIVFPRI
jgi:hypothetical protein